MAFVVVEKQLNMCDLCGGVNLKYTDICIRKLISEEKQTKVERERERVNKLAVFKF